MVEPSINKNPKAKAGTTKKANPSQSPQSGAGGAEAVPLERLELRPDVGRVHDEVLLRRHRAPPDGLLKVNKYPK